MNLDDFNERFPGLEEQFGGYMPDLALMSHDDKVKNKEALLEASQRVSFNEFSYGDFGLLEMDPVEPGQDQAAILFKVDPVGKEKKVIPKYGMRITIEESTVEGVEGGKDYILEGASIDSFMTRKGEFRKGCNLLITPVKYAGGWDYISRLSRDDLKKFLEAGVLEVKGSYTVEVDTSSKPLVMPPLVSVCRIGAEEEILRTLHWKSPSSLESES